jgi:iron-sulfur cluster assembly protein
MREGGDGKPRCYTQPRFTAELKETEHVEIVERPETEIVTLTERAADKIKGLMAEEPDGEASVLRVAIQGGGCSGFEYALGFDQGPQQGDVELDWHGVTVVVDPFSAPYLRGASIDFLETLQESGFKIENPNATSACGCGHSFQVAEGEELPEDQVGGCGSGCSH